jgi:membrane fusion protein (multidrug efflux system)
MRRVMSWLLALLAVAAFALAIAERFALLPLPGKTPPAPALAILGAALLGLAILINLPLRARRPIVFLLVLVIFAALIGGLSYFQFVAKPVMLKTILAKAFAPKPTSVSVEASRYESWPPVLTEIGTLRAFQGVTVAPQVAGVVTGIHFDSGDNVKEGALLVAIDDSVEQADLANNVAQLKNANLAFDRQKSLVAGGNTPQSSVDAAIAARDSAAAAVDRTRAIIAQKAIRAPFAGRLGLRTVDIGQFVAVGTALTTLQRLDPIFADFTAPEGDLARLAVGQPVSIAIDAYPGQNFAGKITAIDARVSAESRNVTVRAQFDNPDAKLLPGMFANVAVTTGEPVKVLTLPRTAAIYSLYGDNVFVVKSAPASADASADKPGLVVERRFVKFGATKGERIAVDSGLNAGEDVVTAGQVKLQNNSPVVIDESGALVLPAVTPKP